MVDFSNKIIGQIKEATGDSHVKIIIEDSFQKQSTKNNNGSRMKRRLLMNTVMALRYVKAEGLDARASQNVDTAIEILEQLRKQEYGDLF